MAFNLFQFKLNQLLSKPSNMNTKTILSCLLIIVAFWQCVWTWDMKYLLENLLPLAKLIQIQEVNWFVSQLLDTESSENLQQFFNTMHRETGVTQMVFNNNNSDIRILRTTSKRNYMGMVFTNGPEDPIMWVHDKVLLGRHFYLNFVILVKPVQDFSLALQLLRTIRGNNFFNTWLYVSYANATSNFFGFDMFSQFEPVKFTNLLLHLKSMFKMVNNIDCQGCNLSTPMRLDLPGVFHYYDHRKNLLRQGTAYRIFELFAHNINATLASYEMPVDSLGGLVVNMKDVLNLIRHNEILITAHAYALYTSDDDVDKSYPLMVVKWCLMVPIFNSVTGFYYPLMPLDSKVWLLIFISFIALAITDALWLIWASHKNPFLKAFLIRRVRDSILDNYCYLFNLAASRNFKQPAAMKVILYATVFFHAFFITANYTSLLGSILTVNILRDQINTLEDLIKANISTLIIDYEFDFLLSSHTDLPFDFLKLIQPVDSATFNAHQAAFDQSYAYFVTEDKWHFLELQQIGLKQGRFKFTDICFGSYHLAFPMEMDSPLWRYLEYFIYRVHSSGLLRHYETISFEHAVYAGHVQRFSQNNEYQAAEFIHVSMLFLMLILVDVACVFILVVEWIHYRLNRRGRFNFKKIFKKIKWKFI